MMNSLQKMISNTSTELNGPIEKICPLCQKKFIPKGRQKYCDGPHFKPCPVCGKPVPAPYPSDPPKCCSAECRKQLKNMSSTSVMQRDEAQLDTKDIQSNAVEVHKKEYLLDPDLELSTAPLVPLDKGAKEFFTKQCIVDSKIKGLINNHVYSIEVAKSRLF